MIHYSMRSSPTKNVYAQIENDDKPWDFGKPSFHTSLFALTANTNSSESPWLGKSHIRYGLPCA